MEERRLHRHPYSIYIPQGTVDFLTMDGWPQSCPSGHGLCQMVNYYIDTVHCAVLPVYYTNWEEYAPNHTHQCKKVVADELTRGAYCPSDLDIDVKDCPLGHTDCQDFGRWNNSGVGQIVKTAILTDGVTGIGPESSPHRHHINSLKDSANYPSPKYVISGCTTCPAGHADCLIVWSSKKVMLFSNYSYDLAYETEYDETTYPAECPPCPFPWGLLAAVTVLGSAIGAGLADKRRR